MEFCNAQWPGVDFSHMIWPQLFMEVAQRTGIQCIPLSMAACLSPMPDSAIEFLHVVQHDAPEGATECGHQSESRQIERRLGHLARILQPHEPFVDLRRNLDRARIGQADIAASDQ